MAPVSHSYQYYLGEYTSNYFMNNELDQQLPVTLIRCRKGIGGGRCHGLAHALEAACARVGKRERHLFGKRVRFVCTRCPRTVKEATRRGRALYPTPSRPSSWLSSHI